MDCIAEHEQAYDAMHEVHEEKCVFLSGEGEERKREGGRGRDSIGPPSFSLFFESVRSRAQCAMCIINCIYTAP